MGYYSDMNILITVYPGIENDDDNIKFNFIVIALFTLH